MSGLFVGSAVNEFLSLNFVWSVSLITKAGSPHVVPASVDRLTTIPLGLLRARGELRLDERHRVKRSVRREGEPRVTRAFNDRSRRAFREAGDRGRREGKTSVEAHTNAGALRRSARVSVLLPCGYDVRRVGWVHRQK